ncbi:hypothetical protein ACYBKS_27555, partial [Klebsiella pneumoniae]
SAACRRRTGSMGKALARRGSMSDLIIPILITLLIIGLVGIVLRLDKIFFKRRDERDDFE